MLKKMMFRGTVLIGSLIAAITVLDKIEVANNKRKAKPIKVIDLTEKDDITDEDVEEAMSLQQ